MGPQALGISMLMSDDARPTKRQHSEDNVEDCAGQVLGALLSEELDVEIGLRNQLKQTVESRLEWALYLQGTAKELLNREHANYADSASNQFADAAIAAYKATNAPLGLLIAPDAGEVPIQTNTPTQAGHSGQQSIVQSRHPNRIHVPHLHHEDRAVKEPNKYLFLRDTSVTPALIYKLACPDCQRSNFPRLQGLLNHCRLKHKREFGSHDECVQHCARVVPGDEQVWVVEHGLEVTGMSASLRRLFEMAVGSYGGVVGMITGPMSVANGEDSFHTGRQTAEENNLTTNEESTIITKILGHHKDTPALAPFLGRAPKKRRINVFEPEKAVDILGVDEISHRISWSMVYHGRSRSGAAGDIDAVDGDDVSPFDKLLPTLSEASERGSSRFHMTARLAIQDWSLRLTDDEVKDCEVQTKATHKWMILVQAPSYSLHASTVLRSVTVSSSAIPAPTSLYMPMIVSEPPYFVMGVTDRSFLARITFEWAGFQNKATQIEHWVEIDLGKSSRPVLGDEQVIDVELDRHTEFLPRRCDVQEIDWKMGFERKYRGQATESSISALETPHIAQIKKLLPRFPITADGQYKGPPLPYDPVPSIQDFLKMDEGKRKAIEWSCAQALWDALSSSRSIILGASGHQASSSRMNNEELLSVTDVHRFLETNGHFPRRPTQGRSQAKAQGKAHAAQKEFCSFCGLQPSSHRRPKSGQSAEKDSDDGPLSRVCPLPDWSLQRPIVDVDLYYGKLAPLKILRRSAGPNSGSLWKAGSLSRFHLMRTVDPALTLAVARVTASLRLPCLVKETGFRSRLTGDVHTELEPYAVLALCVQILVQRLMNGGLHALDPKLKTGGSQTTVGSAGVRKRRMIVPAHIIRGLVETPRRRGSADMQRALLLLGMSRLGTQVGNEYSEDDSDRPEARDES